MKQEDSERSGELSQEGNLLVSPQVSEQNPQSFL